MVLAPVSFAQPVAPGTSRADVSRTDRGAALKAVAESWLARSGAPGITLAAIGPDNVLVKAAAGHARVATGMPMAPDDRMFAGSIGKTYFAAVILQLAGEGRLDLDAPISQRVGGEAWFECLPNAKDLTLRVLLNHTSGIDEHVDDPEFLEFLKIDPMKRWDFGELLRTFACDEPALFEVGKGWSYADTNYIIAGLVTEKITGTSMYDLVRARLLGPLELGDTIPAEGPEIPGLITGYEGPGRMFTNAEEVAVNGRCVLNPQFEWCGGGFVSTSPDLARWGRALWAGDVLGPAMKQEMLQGIEEKRTGPNDSYGLGVIIWRSPIGRALGHTGMFPGYVSQVFHFEELNVTVAMQTNTLDSAKLKGLRQVLIDAAKVMGPPRPSDNRP